MTLKWNTYIPLSTLLNRTINLVISHYTSIFFLNNVNYEYYT